MPSREHSRAWEDWGEVNPLYAILTDPRFRHGGDIGEFMASGEPYIGGVLAETERLAICSDRVSALDFGCGVGRLTAPLSRHFERALGVDISPSMLERARELHADIDNCEFRLNEGDDLGWIEDRSFDLILSLLVLQHMDSVQTMERFLREFMRVLKPGGALVFQIPSSVPAHRPPLPSWKTRQGLRVRTANALRQMGVPAHILYHRMDWVPEMTLLALSDGRTRAVLEAAGGTVAHVTSSAADAGGTVDRTYFVTRLS